MLEGKNGGWHKHCYLFTVGNRLESSPDGDFCFSETDISTDQAIHRMSILHIVLDRRRGALLVRSILIHERRFELFLHIGVGGKGKSLGGSPLGIKHYKVFGYVFYLVFRPRLQCLPGLAAEFVYFWNLTVGRTVARNFIKGMYAHKHHIPVFIHKFHHFSRAAFIVKHLHQSSENSNSMVDMHHIVAQSKGIQVVKGELFGFFDRAPHSNAVEALEYLVVGIAADFVFAVYEADMDISAFYKFGQMTGGLLKDILESV